VSIRPFYGDFFGSPYPLEMELDRCSHNCAYCFANLNVPTRRINRDGLFRFIADYRNRKTLEATLMQQGYPVLISNVSDPFAASTHQVAVPAIRMLTELGVRVALQTRGGFGLDEVLEFLPPSHWYISICQSDDADRARIEPNAPTLESRYKLMERLAKLGHLVSLGLQPLDPAWIPDPYPVLQRAFDSGASGTWVQGLHFNRHQLTRLSPRQQQALGPDLIQAALVPAPRRDPALYWNTLETAKRVGLAVFCASHPFETPYWDKIRELYPVTFPVMADFVNWCWRNLQDDVMVTFEDYWAVIGPRFPDGEWRIGDFIRVQARNIDQTNSYSRKMTFRALAQIVWNDYRVFVSPARNRAFGIPVGLDAEGEPVALSDEDGNAVYVFRRDVWAEPYLVVDNLDELPIKRD